MAKKEDNIQQVLESPVSEEQSNISGVLGRAEIDSQIATAKKFPRDIARFQEKLLGLATSSPEISASCYYAIPRKGKTIEGPSVRLAELALSCYQNCIAQGAISHADDKAVHAVGMCRDLENNTAVRRLSWRRITYSDGRRYNDDMVFVTGNAAASIAFRDAVFAVIPRCYIEPVWKACQQVAAGKAKTLTDAKDRAIEYLEQVGVSSDRVLAALHRRSVEDITKADIITLRGFCTAIKDGEAEIDTIFPPLNEENAAKPVVQAEEIPPKQQKTKKSAKVRKGKRTNLF